MPPETTRPGSPAPDGAAPPRAVERPAAQEPRAYAPLLDVLRILAILGVVTVHVIADHVSAESPVAVLLLRSLLAVAVPAFIMISGALNLDPAAMRDGTGPFLARRLRRLLPATVVWTVLYVIVSAQLAGGAPRAEDLAMGVLEASIFPHLYFLPLIIGLTVITPPLATYLAQSSRRAWGVGAVTALWACTVMAIGPLTSWFSDDPLMPMQLGALTYFLPYVGYYVLGRAAWAAPPARTGALAALAACGMLMTAATVLAYSAPWTQVPPGSVLLPTYLAPTVMAMSVSWVALVLAVGRSWRVGERAQRVLRELGNATFGVFLLHFAVLVLLRELGAPQDSVAALVLLDAAVVAVSFALVLLGRRLPLVREIL